MDSSTSPNDLIIINTRSPPDANDDFRLLMPIEFDELNKKVPLLTESRASLQQQQTSKQSNNQNIDQSNIVALTKSSSSSCQLTTTIEISNDDHQQQEKQFKCKHCKASFYTHNALRMHIEVFHKSKSESVNATQTNVNQFETSNALFKCCDKVFYTVKEVRIHMQMHIGLPEYQKNVVNPGTISKLTQNEQPNHESEHQFNELTKSSNQFSCLECGRKFLNKRTLYDHIYYSKNVHQKQLQPCEVNWCGKQFKTKSDLYCHYFSVHKAVKFPCTQCNRFKKGKDLMANHLQKYHEIEYPELNSIPSEQAVASLSNCDQQNNSNYGQLDDGQLDDGHGDNDDDEIEFIGYHQKIQKQQKLPVTSTSTIQIENPFRKCKWEMCDRVFVCLEDMRTHIIDVHVYGLNSEDRENSGKRSIKTQKTDEQSIEQVNPIEVIDRDESMLDEIVTYELSSNISHDHIYHQTDHLSTPPSNANASLRCTFAECCDLTFNHLPNLLRHTRLKHPESLHQIHLKPFRNSRRTTQSNHVFKNVLTSKIKCSLCDKWFQRQDGLEIHSIQEHMVIEVVSGGISECTSKLESDEELERHRGVHHPEHQITGRNKSIKSIDKSLKSAQLILVDIRSDSGEESIDETESVENAVNETYKSDEKSIEKMVFDDEELHQPEHHQPFQELNESINDKLVKSTQQLLIDESMDGTVLDEDETNDSDESSFEETSLENYNDLYEQSMNKTDSESNVESMNETNYEMSLKGMDSFEKKFGELTMKETGPYGSEINDSNEGNLHPELEHQVNVGNEPTIDKSNQQLLVVSDSNEEAIDEADSGENETDETTNDSNEASLKETDLNELSMNETDSDGEELYQVEKQQPQYELNKPTNKSKSLNPDVKYWRPIRCLHCDDSFEMVDDLKNHFKVFHTIKTIVTNELSGCTRTVEEDDEIDRDPGVIQQHSDHQINGLNESTNNKSVNSGQIPLVGTGSDCHSNEELIDETNYDKSLDGIDSDEEDSGEKKIDETDSNKEDLHLNQQLEHQINGRNGSAHDKSDQQQPEHRFSERLTQNECHREESDFDDQILGEMNSDEESSEVSSDWNQLIPNADCKETTSANYMQNAIDNDECVDYLAAIEIDNLDYQNQIEMTNDQVNPPTQLYTPLSDCIMSNPSPSQSISSSLDQFCVNLDQSSPNSIPCSIQDISDLITFHPNVHLNQPNPQTHLSSPISDCIVPQSNPLPNQHVSSNLDQFKANLNQSNPISPISTTNLISFISNVHLNQPNPQTHLSSPLSDCIMFSSNAPPIQSISSSLQQLEQLCANLDQPNFNSMPNHPLFKMNQNLNSSNLCINIEIASVQSIQDISYLMTFQTNQNLDQQSPNLTQPDSKSNFTLQHTNITLNQSTTLSIHQPEPQVSQLRKSTKQTSVKCPKCDKFFTHRDSLRVHCFNMHPAQTPLCEVSDCGKTFETKTRLITHYRDIHRGVNFPCAKCYNRKELIVDHLRTYHQIDFNPSKLKQPSLNSTQSTPNPILVESNLSTIQSDTLANISTFSHLTQSTNVLVDRMPIQQQIAISNNDDQNSIISQQTQLPLFQSEEFDQILNLFEQTQGIEANDQSIDSEECDDCLPTLQLDNLNFLDEIDNANDQVNPPTHLSTPLLDCIMPQSNTLPSQSLSLSLEQFCVNLDQPSPNSIPNHTLIQINQNQNSSNFYPETTSEQSSLIEDISDLIIFHSNQNLDQSNLNLTQNTESQHIFKQSDQIQCSSVLATDVNSIINSSLRAE